MPRPGFYADPARMAAREAEQYRRRVVAALPPQPPREILVRLPRNVEVERRPHGHDAGVTAQLRTRLAACTSEDECLQASLALHSDARFREVSEGTRRKWSRLVRARIEELEAEQRRPKPAGSLIVPPW